MNNLRAFNHNQFGRVRVIYKEGVDEVWFVAKDITDALGLSNTTMALQGLEDFERTKLNLGRQGETNVISESGVYALIMRSRKEEAKKFRVWVTSTVLPSIRKSGGYIQNQENLTSEQILANAVLVAENVIKKKELQLEKERLLREEAQQKVQLQAPKVLAYDSLMDIGKDLDFSATAKAFNIPGLGRNNLMKLLRDKKVLMKNNNPYQNFIDAGYFRIIVIPNEFSPTKTLITSKGLKWLAGKLVSWGYLANSQNVN